MKTRTFVSLFTLGLLFAGNVLADESNDYYTAALKNITDGNYRIYAEVGGTKYYLKDSRTKGDNEVDFVTATTTQGEATVFTISQVEQSGGLVSKPWLIASNGYCFTNPSGGKEKEETFTAGTCFRGYLISKRTNVCDRQVLYYNGSAYAVRSTNKSDGYWGGKAYWGISSDGNATYVTDASYIWHFEAVGGVSEITGGKYQVKGANASWSGGSEPYWINNSKSVFCLWYDVKQATTFDVVRGTDDVLYVYDAAQKKYMTVTSGNIWYTSPNSVSAIYAQGQTYNSVDYFALTNNADATFGTTSAFCTADATTRTGNFADGYGYNPYVENTYLCAAGTGKSGDDTDPNALWSFIEAGSSEGTIFDITALQHGTPGLVAALKANNQGNVSYTLTVGNALAATLCLPFEASIPEGITAYTLAFSGSDLKATAVTTTLPANTPVLIKAIEAKDYTFMAAVSSIADADSYVSGAMTGLMERQNLSEGYILQNKDGKLGFFKMDGSTFPVNAFRAYIPASSIPSAVKSFNIVFDDGNATGIAEMENVKCKMENAEAFDLSGRKVGGVRSALPLRSAKNSHLKKGIYIVNGKTVIVR